MLRVALPGVWDVSLGIGGEVLVGSLGFGRMVGGGSVRGGVVGTIVLCDGRVIVSGVGWIIRRLVIL